MPDKAWKAAERRICEVLGLWRRGPTGKDDNDCEGDAGFSVEIRHRKQISFNMIQSQLDKAKDRAREGDIPIFVGSQPYMHTMDTVVCMRMNDFLLLMELAIGE